MNYIIDKLKKFRQHFISFPTYILTHPIDGFYEMKRGRQGNMKVVTIFILIEAIFGIIEFKYTGFLFNNVDPNKFSFIKEILMSITPYLLLIVSNWTITTLMNGKGKMKDIYMVVGYALFPGIVLKIFNVFMSNQYTLDEEFFYHFAQSLAYFIFLFLVFMGLLVIHEYTVLRTVVTVVLTLVSMSVFMFIGILSFSLLQQVYVFIDTIIKEIILRV